MDLPHILTKLDASYRSFGDPRRAKKQAQYMRDQFEFYGLQAPKWRRIAQDHFTQNTWPSPQQLRTLAVSAFSDYPREMQYTALWIYEKMNAKLEANHIEDYTTLIQTKSWWDTVDHLAKLVGMLFARYPNLKTPTLKLWLESNNMWLHRVCIIHQLHYKEKTDRSFLFQTVERFGDSKEFFIQKACGWALRQYGKIYPEEVKFFVQSQDLPSLTTREALKNL